MKQRQRRKGDAHPVCGRKHCFDCGRWRPITDYTPQSRDEHGNVAYFKPFCNFCRRMRWRQGRRYSPAAMERRREYDRIRQEALRRERGARVLGPRARNPVAVGRQTERIPNAPLREAFLASGMTAVELARAAGYTRPRRSRGKTHLDQADQELVKRMLGLVDGKPGEPRQKTVAYKHAARLVRAMDLVPAEYGV